MNKQELETLSRNILSGATQKLRRDHGVEPQLFYRSKGILNGFSLRFLDQHLDNPVAKSWIFAGIRLFSEKSECDLVGTVTEAWAHKPDNHKDECVFVFAQTPLLWSTAIVNYKRDDKGSITEIEEPFVVIQNGHGNERMNFFGPMCSDLQKAYDAQKGTPRGWEEWAKSQGVST